MRSKYAFVTFVYKGVEKYLPIFFESLSQQTDIDFDLVIHNDGIEELNSLIQINNLHVYIISSGINDLFQNRLWTFNYCRDKGYSHIILGDSDDFFDCNRVHVVKKFLHTFDIVINDISLINIEGRIYEERIFSRRLYNQSIISFENILKHNFIGFTNSAFSVEVLKNIQFSDIRSKIVDWVFYSILLRNGYSAIFTTETFSIYRQHENNIAELKYSDEERSEKNQSLLTQVIEEKNKILESINYKDSKHSKIDNCKIRKINFWWEF